MVELLRVGPNRIAYQANNFGTGKTVNASIWGPTSSVWNSGNAFTEASEGVYYLDYTFPVTGAYIFKFAENGNAQTTSAYRVWNTDTNVDYISSQIEAYGGGGVQTVVVPEGRKSPWTYRQKENMISQMNEVLGILNSLQDRDNNELKEAIRNDIKELKKSNDRIKSSYDENVVDVKNKVNGIINKLSELELKSDSEDVSGQINKLYDLLVKSLCDDDLEKMINEIRE